MIEIKETKSVFSEVKDFCHLSKQHDYISVAEWINGEGYDITVWGESEGMQRFGLSYGQFKLLKKLIKTLDK